MPKPQAYITRRIPQAAIDIVAAACDYRVWESDDQPVPRELLDQVLEAARWAPSPHGRQPWRFVVVEDLERRRALGRVAGESMRDAGAPSGWAR